MTDHDPLEREPLAARLSNLRLPESGALAPRVIQRYRQEAPRRARQSGQAARRHHRRRLGLGLLALLAAQVAVVLSSPGARVAVATAVADAPVVGHVAAPLLRMAGLEPIGDRIRSQPASTTSAGHTITFVGAYADNTQTVVFLQLDPNLDLVPELEPDTLTDRSGRRATSLNEASGYEQRGNDVLTFGPLIRPGVNHLVLRIHRLEVVAPSNRVVIAGNWILRFDVAMDSGAALLTAAPGKLGNIDVSLASSAAGNHINCLVTLTGPPADLTDLAQAAAEGNFRLRLVDAAGTVVSERGMTGAVSGLLGSDRYNGTYHGALDAPHPGTYRIVISRRNYSFQQTVTVR